MVLPYSVRRLPIFESLHNRDFRWFWLARLAHSASMEMGSVALGWLACRLTGSALALGWVASARSIARLILSLYGGALADRLQKRQVLVWARAAMLAKSNAAVHGRRPVHPDQARVCGKGDPQCCTRDDGSESVRLAADQGVSEELML